MCIRDSQITEAEGLGILLGIPRGAVGPMGPRGDPGTGLDILGTFASLEALQAAVANPCLLYTSRCV